MRALLALALMATPVAAQEVQQTPEGAQRFLSIIAETVPLQIEEPHRENGRIFIHFRVDSIEQGNDLCLSTIGATPQQFTGSKNPATERDIQQLPSLIQRYGIGSPPFVVNWSNTQLSEITDPQNGQTHLVLTMPHQTLNLLAMTSDQAVHKRIKYAMTFLKEACDKTAETGF